MPQTKPMIKGAQASDTAGLVSDQLRRHSLDGRVRANYSNLRVEALHEGRRRPEIQPSVSRDVHS